MSVAVMRPREWPIWDLLFPPLCKVCDAELDRNAILFCRQCWADAPIAEMHDLHKLHHMDMVVSGFRYAANDVVRGSVRALKYDGVRPLAAIMAKRLVSRLPTKCVEQDLVWVAVPLHVRRILLRGFNQSQLLAGELARSTNHDPPVKLLKRVRHTPSQTARTYRERAANVRGAFAVSSGHELPQRVLLIDDVITTGATVDECARTLKEAGVQWVGALSFALAHHP